MADLKKDISGHTILHADANGKITQLNANVENIQINYVLIKSLSNELAPVKLDIS